MEFWGWYGPGSYYTHPRDDSHRQALQYAAWAKTDNPATGQPSNKQLPSYIHTNYLRDGRDNFLLTPEDRGTGLYEYERGAKGVYNYRGHDWRLWNDDGTPTDYKLRFFHDAGPEPRGDQPANSYQFHPSTQGRNQWQDFNERPHSWLSSVSSKGYFQSNLVDRDTHLYALYKDTNPAPFPENVPLVKGVPNPYLRSGDQAAGLPGMSPAPDPVQREAMPPNTTPRARMISRGESKIAMRVESAATKKDEL